MCKCEEHKKVCTERHSEWLMEEGAESVKNLLKTIEHINEQVDSSTPYLHQSDVECMCHCWKAIGEIVDIHKDHVKIKLMHMEMDEHKMAHEEPMSRPRSAV